MDPNTNPFYNYNGMQAPVVTPESTVHYVSTLESLDSLDFDDVEFLQTPLLAEPKQSKPT
jgi:hypothetical protein